MGITLRIMIWTFLASFGLAVLLSSIRHATDSFKKNNQCPKCGGWDSREVITVEIRKSGSLWRILFGMGTIRRETRRKVCTKPGCAGHVFYRYSTAEPPSHAVRAAS